MRAMCSNVWRPFLIVYYMYRGKRLPSAPHHVRGSRGNPGTQLSRFTWGSREGKGDCGNGRPGSGQQLLASAVQPSDDSGDTGMFPCACPYNKIHICRVSVAASTVVLIEMIIIGQLGWLDMEAGYRYELYGILFLLTALAWYRHRANLGRLLKGNGK